MERSSPHIARSFGRPPNATQAIRLSAELATRPCPFSPVPADRPLALYGAGRLGRLARDYLTTVGYDLAMVVDRNAAERARESYWSAKQVFRPDDVPPIVKRRYRLAVSIANAPYVPLERSLLERGFDDVVPFYDLAETLRASHPLSNGWFAPALTPSDQKNVTKVLALWHDDMSRAHHLQFLAWRRLREEWYFDGAPVTTDNRFFIPELSRTLRAHEVFLDAGAHHGLVIEAFVRQTQGSFRQIAAVEPDPANRAILHDRLRKLLPRDPRVVVYDCALATNAGEALFHDGLGYASQLSPTGRASVTTCPLDALDLKPSFIKLHLEGSELAVLQGARATLTANRPIIAATVYHNADGIWKTPLWLMQTLPAYRFLFRAHSWCGTGAVVYALPEERSTWTLPNTGMF